MIDKIKCWTCGDPVKYPIIVATREGATMESKDMHPDFRPIVWRLVHKTEDCLPVEKNDRLTADCPMNPVTWVQLTIRLLDMKGEWFLFKMTNWRYVLECAQDNQTGYLPGINEFKNPKIRVPKRKPDPETTMPDGKRVLVKPRKIIRRRPAIKRSK